MPACRGKWSLSQRRLILLTCLDAQTALEESRRKRLSPITPLPTIERQMRSPLLPVREPLTSPPLLAWIPCAGCGRLRTKGAARARLPQRSRLLAIQLLLLMPLPVSRASESMSANAATTRASAVALSASHSRRETTTAEAASAAR